ncbi:MAG: hypothetical protein WEA28_07490 [Xanthobacteraceae bacterium]
MLYYRPISWDHYDGSVAGKGWLIVSVHRALLQTTMLAGVVGAAFLSARDAQAADLSVGSSLPVKSVFAPNYSAVDGVNGKVEALGGTLAHKSLYGSRGALSIPLAGHYGLQIDGALGSLQNRGFGTIGGHLFWRDPAQGLLGVYAGYTRWNQFGGVHVTQVAGEGEYYWQRFTLRVIAGIESGSSADSTTVSVATVAQAGATPGLSTTSTFIEGYDVKTRFFDHVDLKYYPTDNWAGYIGHRYLGGKHALALGGEAAFPLGGGRMASAFVEGRIGEGDFQGVWGGLKLYFGQKDKTLIRRHREDDPGFVDALPSITNNYFTSGSSSSSLFCAAPGFSNPTTCETPSGNPE